MRGTEKQIKWALEIQKTTLETIDYMIGFANTEGRERGPEEKMDALIARLTRVREALVNAPYASDVIDCYKQVKATDPMLNRVGSVMAALKVKAPCTDYQYKLLDR